MSASHNSTTSFTSSSSASSTLLSSRSSPTELILNEDELDAIDEFDAFDDHELDDSSLLKLNHLIAATRSQTNAHRHRDKTTASTRTPHSSNKRKRSQHIKQSHSDGVCDAVRQLERKEALHQQRRRKQNTRSPATTLPARSPPHAPSAHDTENDEVDPRLARRRHTISSSSAHRLANTRENNYYAQIRFYRQNVDFIHHIQHRYDLRQKRQTAGDAEEKRNAIPLFPGGEHIKDYVQFRDKYRFVMQGNNRKLVGYGAMSAVYKVYTLSNRRQKYAAKISSYRSQEERARIIAENRLLHRFGNGLHIQDIYDDEVNGRLIFIQPYGKDLKTWWNHREHGIVHKFNAEDAKTQEWILKKILYQILLNLKQIHDAGYIHHDIKPQNILVTRVCRREGDHQQHRYQRDRHHWIDRYQFHIIDYGLTIPCGKGQRIELNETEIRFGTFGYNAWELMKTHQHRAYAHSIDLYALAIAICELVVGQHMLRHHDDFKRKQDEFCYQQLIDKYHEQEQYFANNHNQDFYGFSEYELYATTLRLKCDFWRLHFRRNNGTSHLNGDESNIRSIVIKELQYKTPYTTRFKNFISNLIRDNPRIRISSVDAALNHDLFYNL